jgi:hypothetical protein
MCLTKTLANQIPIPAPAGYSESNYEVLGRLITAYIDAGTTPSMTTFMNVTSFTINGTDKTDINNNGAFSTDFLGMADNYATASYAQRALIEQQHKDYIQGFLYYLGHSTRVPLAVRNQMLAYGFCKDEFTDNGGFGALYVREARRMVSDYVMRQQNCQGTETVADSVGLGSYTMDAHNTRRIVQTVMVSGQPKDVLRNEGDVQQTIPAVYPISYRSLVPKVGECENLLVPWCLSASHMAFGSIRMEPVFMILSQSAGSAAVIAIDNDVPVQQVSYPKLALQLTVDGQALTNGSPATDGIVIDNADTTGITKIGNWVTSAASTGFYGADYWHDNATDKGLNSVRFTPNIPATGDYDVYIRYPSNPNRSTNVPVDVISASGTQTFTVNQVNNGGTWNFLQRATFNAGTNGSVLIRTTNTAVGTYVIADAVRFVSTTNGGPAVQIIASDAETREGAANPARFSVFRATSDTASPLVVNYTISGTATNGVDYNTLPGSVTVPAGSATAAISVQAIGDAIAEGTDTLTLTLAAGTGYNLGTVNAATMKILDRPVDDWRHANFTPAQLADPNVSGDLADADRDSLQTLAEYALGGDPNATTALPTPVNTGGYLTLTYARRKSATDVTINVEATHDLKNWTPLAPVEQVSIADAGAFELVTVRIATPISQDPQAFLRLKVTRP